MNTGNNFESNSGVTQPTSFGSLESYQSSNNNDGFNSDRIKRKPSGFSLFEESNNGEASFNGPVEFSHFGGSNAFESSIDESSFSSNSPRPPAKENKYKLKNYRQPIKKIGTETSRSNQYKRETPKPAISYKSRSASSSDRGKIFAWRRNLMKYAEILIHM